MGGVSATGRFFSATPGDTASWTFGEQIFIGVQNEVIEDLHETSEAAPIVVEPHSAEDVIRGADGLIVARHSAVTSVEQV